MLFVYFLCVVANFVVSFIAIAIFILLYPFARARKKLTSWVIGNVLFVMFFKIVPALRMYKMDCDARIMEGIGGGNVIIANHISWLDPLILLALVPNAGIVLKEKYAHQAIWLMTKIHNFICVSDHDISSLGQVYKKGSDILKNGGNLIVFPEGHRSRSYRPSDFRKMAFKLSKDLNAPLRPLVFYYKNPIFASGNTGFFPQRNCEITLRILPPIVPSNFKDCDSLTADAYSKITRKVIELRTEKS